MEGIKPLKTRPKSRLEKVNAKLQALSSATASGRLSLEPGHEAAHRRTFPSGKLRFVRFNAHKITVWRRQALMREPVQTYELESA
jgi:hypothetical protein